MCVLPKGRCINARTGTYAAVLPKADLPPHARELRLLVYQGVDRCGSFPLLSAPHSLFSIWTDLQISQGHNVVVRRVDLANWALRTSPKFITEVKYQFHRRFWPDRKSGNHNHPSLPYTVYHHQCVLQANKPRIQFCRRQVFHRKLRNQGCSFTRYWIGVLASRCFPLPTLSLFSIRTDFKMSERSQGHQRGGEVSGFS